MLCPGSSAFVESDSKRWTPRPASSANRGDRCEPVDRRRIELEVAGVQHRARRRVDRDRHPSGIEWVTWKNRIENPSISSEPPGSATIRSASGHAVLLEFALQSSSVKAEPTPAPAAEILQQVRSAPT
jgi:hypothetical protein